MAYKPTLMTKAELKEKGGSLKATKIKSAIKRINTRISAIAKTFGTDSSLYMEIVERLTTIDKNGEFTHESKSGVIQLNVSNKLITSEIGTHVYNSAKYTRTLSQIKESYAPQQEGSAKDLKNVILERKTYENEIASEIANMMSTYDETHTDAETDALKEELYGEKITIVTPNGTTVTRYEKKPTYEDIEEYLEKFERGNL